VYALVRREKTRKLLVYQRGNLLRCQLRRQSRDYYRGYPTRRNPLPWSHYTSPILVGIYLY
jgi:hypothetical protein